MSKENNAFKKIILTVIAAVILMGASGAAGYFLGHNSAQANLSKTMKQKGGGMPNGKKPTGSPAGNGTKN
ncbi:hypothetical protein [Liquorilactobacillus satsumensis]|uniref:Uncharacterized protein n=1 Tax=Liquorilactobacillus satsumensis DSM 16230 = JCM 12392 TaxID=1423801 RepID=A0A0R1V1T9_9LACO|nr:hypothetical protein [Liquorilactobacillus satsumensis]KRL99486.1 hypothetical protein FD50_GL000184 [Liquorilactobacillus satsumensis DSM 16230 = JCM 12392]MCC7665963.1 hypothetical protein [Liquorilactobacillus satsumensis]MCP9312077.1 hypothetical protein [Liquorilactobacillus satsumensis]MCP9327836.1 hypothetical protein [Liquorilactobacillus satsumensis]MCP9356669.1 hypothetical protein [Liquorilactobacillus satsumensis]